VLWVRAYERRGPIFSDIVLINRADLISRLRAGQCFVVGKRVIYQGNKFETSLPVQLVQKNGGEFLVTANSSAGHDHLEGVPAI
jgi:hypothetical protein